MKLSEAIIQGCKLFPNQHTGGHYANEDGSKLCVLGTAAAAVADSTTLNAPSRTDVLESNWPEFGALIVDGTVCPKCHDKRYTYFAMCVHMNDDHKISREEIADYLEKQGL